MKRIGDIVWFMGVVSILIKPPPPPPDPLSRGVLGVIGLG